MLDLSKKKSLITNSCRLFCQCHHAPFILYVI